MKREVFRDPVFERRLVVGTECTLQEFLKKFQLEYEGEYTSEPQALMLFDKHGYMWLPKPKMSLVVHELVHYAWATLNFIDIPLNDDTEEVYSCLIEYHFKEVIKRFKLSLE